MKEKLESILREGGFVPKTYFVISDYCVFIQIISLKTADIFLISIPQKFKFKVKSDKNAFKIKFIDISESGIISEDYGKTPDNLDIEDKYEELDLEIDREEYADMEDYLHKAYNRPIQMNEMNKEDQMDVKNNFRQLKRLRFCVQNIPYKLGIIYKNYLCILNPNGEILCFYIKHFNGDEKKRLYIITDLEYLFKNIRETQTNLTSIKKSLFKVLNKNQNNQTDQINKILLEKSNIEYYNNEIISKKEKYKSYIKKLEDNLEKLNENEKRYSEELGKLSGGNSISNDAQVSYQKNEIEKKLEKISALKDKIFRNIIQITEAQEDLYLRMDNIWFDCTVMLDAIVNNFEEVRELTE